VKEGRRRKIGGRKEGEGRRKKKKKLKG